MVAYSFREQFAEPIIALEKRQTVRAPRRRHARQGEPVQLFTGMRTRSCRKLLASDPVCRDVRIIHISLDRQNPCLIASIEIDGLSLNPGEMEAFAWDDGFRPAADGEPALLAMGRFWLDTHGEGTFEGVVIRWEASNV